MEFIENFIIYTCDFLLSKREKAYCFGLTVDYCFGSVINR